MKRQIVNSSFVPEINSKTDVQNKAFAAFTKISRMNLGILGIWPTIRNKKISIGLFFVSITIILSCVVLPQGIKLIKVWGNLDSMSLIISTAELPFIVGLTKLTALFYNKEKISYLYGCMNNHWKIKKNNREMDVMIDYGKRGRNFSLLCLSLGYTTFIAHELECIFRNLSNWTDSEKCKNYTLCLEASFPHDWHSSPAFEFTIFLECIGTFFGMLAYCGPDGFFGLVVLHFSGQYYLLRLQLLDLVNEIDENKPWTEFDKRFSSVVNVHEHINSCIGMIESTYNLMFLIQLLACTIQFCFQGYLLVLYLTDENSNSELVGIIFLVIYFIYMIGNFYVYCYVAETLQVKSLMLTQTAYECEWYNLPPRKAKHLLFLLQSGHKPVELTAGKFCVLNLALFGNIIKTSLGYLSFLITMRQASN